jgi:hypothetical protein
MRSPTDMILLEIDTKQSKEDLTRAERKIVSKIPYESMGYSRDVLYRLLNLWLGYGRQGR